MGKSVLVVDDDSLSRRALAYSLRQSGYLVLEAASGESALDLIRSVDNFGVVIADLRLRGLADGLDVLKSRRYRQTVD